MLQLFDDPRVSDVWRIVLVNTSAFTFALTTVDPTRSLAIGAGAVLNLYFEILDATPVPGQADVRLFAELVSGQAAAQLGPLATGQHATDIANLVGGIYSAPFGVARQLQYLYAAVQAAVVIPALEVDRVVKIWNLTSVAPIQLYVTFGGGIASPTISITAIPNGTWVAIPVSEVYGWTASFSFWPLEAAAAPSFDPSLGTRVIFACNLLYVNPASSAPSLQDKFGISTVSPGLGTSNPYGPRSACVEASVAVGYSPSQASGFSVGVELIPPLNEIDPDNPLVQPVGRHVPRGRRGGRHHVSDRRRGAQAADGVRDRQLSDKHCRHLMGVADRTEHFGSSGPSRLREMAGGSAGLPLSGDELELALAHTDAWVARLVSRAFRDRCESGAGATDSTVQSVARLELALALGAPRRNVCGAAAAAGRLQVLQLARANGCPWDSRTCINAAYGGHLAVLQWARANGCSWDSETCAGAALGGHLEVLKWARANGCEWEASTCSWAARGGHLATLQWARAHGCAWSERTCAHAATGGHLQVLQWLRANGCGWDKWTCTEAVHRGHLEVVQWARANGCAWDVSTWNFSVHQPAVRAWLAANKCPRE